MYAKISCYYWTTESNFCHVPQNSNPRPSGNRSGPRANRTCILTRQKKRVPSSFLDRPPRSGTQVAAVSWSVVTVHHAQGGGIGGIGWFIVERCRAGCNHANNGAILLRAGHTYRSIAQRVWRRVLARKTSAQWLDLNYVHLPGHLTMLQIAFYGIGHKLSELSR